VILYEIGILAARALARRSVIEPNSPPA
jgi:hypothetical protein